jgi:hypothetical protein
MSARRHRIPFNCRYLRRGTAAASGDPSRKMPENPAETFGTRINMYATDHVVCNLIRSA